ncbi:hypothetical protein LTR86_001321 [Recurvomyces mirabilis]|nr:hypothetical protein LTR86_001321 [Recurvomyces mirabilis]
MVLSKIVLIGVSPPIIIANETATQASGTLGTEVLKALTSDTTFEVTVLARPDSAAYFPEHVLVLRPEQTHDNLVQAFTGQDAIVCTTSIAAVPQQKELIDAAIAAGVKRFVLNEFANPLTYGGLPDLQHARVAKLEVLSYAREQAAKHTAFSWTGLATGHFLDYAMLKIPAFGFNIASRKARIVDDGLEPFSATTVPDIAVAILGVLKHPAQTANQYLNIRSTETTQMEILEAFEAQTGMKWEREDVRGADLLTSGREKVQRGERGGMLDLVVAQLLERGSGRAEGHWEDNANGFLGVKQRSTNEIVREVFASLGWGK